ncbi:hypothetical protein V8C44DRAFT_260435 [Trichoderma aethiopicum]
MTFSYVYSDGTLSICSEQLRLGLGAASQDKKSPSSARASKMLAQALGVWKSRIVFCCIVC